MKMKNGMTFNLRSQNRENNHESNGKMLQFCAKPMIFKKERLPEYENFTRFLPR